MREFKILKYPEWPELNEKLRPLILSLSESQEDFRLKQKSKLGEAAWLDKHQYFSIETSWHSQDDLYSHAAFQPLCDFIMSITENEMEFTSMWAKVAKTGNSGIKHRHRGRLSGIYYINVGHSANDRKSGKVNFYHNLTKHTIEPNNGDIIIFPSWMFHDVDEYSGSEPRINISWNMM
tara:strand:- start:148 stop:681 length:534 start_codon:yes stop_codon:yes gene_type:complete